MPPPEGSITPAQYEIMEAVWDRGKAGATVAEIWQVVSASRAVGRTTILNLVDRLEKRGWLSRRQQHGAYRYTAAISREKTAALLAGEFVDDFFGGSASNLVMSLLGAKRLRPEDVERLRRLLQSAPPETRSQKGKQP
jgi:predicted transcriptional regulator